MREQMKDRLADESAEQREVRLQQMSDSQRERMAAETIKLCYHFFILIHSHRFNLINLSPLPPETLQYIHLFIQLDSFIICTLVYIIITILFLHLHFTITFPQTTNSVYACAHQLRLAPQYDMHITSWGKPERAPHRRRVECLQSIYYYYYYYYCYYYYYGTSVTRALL